jgi:hypothetical protein
MADAVGVGRSSRKSSQLRRIHNQTGLLPSEMANPVHLGPDRQRNARLAASKLAFYGISLARNLACESISPISTSLHPLASNDHGCRRRAKGWCPSLTQFVRLKQHGLAGLPGLQYSRGSRWLLRLHRGEEHTTCMCHGVTSLLDLLMIGK